MVLSARQAGAAGSTALPLRYEPNGVYLHGGVTSQTVESTFGNNPQGLPVTGTNTYDFYSPPLSAPFSLTTAAKAGGIVAVTNTAPTSANDFQVGAMMNYHDYDPVTGVETRVANAGQAISPPQNANHGKMALWTLIQNPLAANITIPVGHLIHVQISVAVISGNPGSYGQLLYNGPSGASTVALLPENLSVPLGWTAQSVAVGPPTIISIVGAPDHSMQLNCSGTASGSYLIQATTDLGSPWVTISTNMANSSGLFQYVDTDAPNYSYRFYRASTP